MKYLDEFRDPALAEQLLKQIRQAATRPWVIMDVCGGQTHSLLRYGIESALGDVVELIHGPGCPVCVTPASILDAAHRLALRSDVILASFGDMLRVPGSCESLLDIRARGGHVRIVYSPLDAIEIAKTHPDKQIVFLAVGFETTAPATALAVLQAAALGLENFSLLVSHVCVLPAMESIMLSPHNRVQGFLAAGHACTISGGQPYQTFVDRFSIPVAITGFEPVDLLLGIHNVVQQLESGSAQLSNCYARSVSNSGNQPAQQAIDRVYQLVDQQWRGLGMIAQSGLELREPYRGFDAASRFGLDNVSTESATPTCLSADVLSGRIKPPQCPHFGNTCSPERPLGAPMVSSEGACAAYFRYQSMSSESASGRK
jgi:hydrogenase expression/formation protein HypD